MAARVATGLRVVAALRAGALVVARPHGVAHLYSGPRTRGGKSTPRGRRPLCGARTRRLTVLEVTPGGAVELNGRRFCRRCTSSLVPSLGLDLQRLVSRDDWAAAYGHLTEADLIQAAWWTNDTRPDHAVRALADNHQVGHVASVVLGGLPHTRVVEDVLLPIRNRLRVAARTPDEQAAADAARSASHAATEDAAHLAAARRRADRVAAAVDRRNRGGYLAPHERDLIASA